jgi:peroxiredoxin (alkyl hydroperoxide reductase subunit C)
LLIGETLPEFRVRALVDDGGGVELGELSSSELRGRWSVLLYWPCDFSQVCPELLDAVAQAQAAAPEASFLAATAGVDPVRLAEDWRRNVLRLRAPIAVDERGELAAVLGLPGADRRTARITFVVDAEARARWLNFSDISPRRDLRQALLTLRALRLEDQPESSGHHHHHGDETLIAMCAWCRRVRDAGGWYTQETYIRRRTGNEFTHGICGDCMGEFRGL